MAQESSERKLNNSLNLLAKTSLIVFMGLFLSKIFTYAYRIIVARYFGVEVYGLFSLALIVLGVFIAVLSLGFPEGILRYIPLFRGKNEYKKINYLFWYSATVLFVLSIISTILMYSLSEYISINIFHNSDLIIFLKIFAILIPIYVFSTFFSFIIRAYEKISAFSFAINILPNFVKLVAILILIYIGFNSNAVIYSYFLSMFSILVFSFLFCKYKLPQIFKKQKLSERTKRSVKKDFFSYSWPIMFLSVIASVFHWSDSFIIGIYTNVSDVGLYNAAIPLVQLLMIVPELFMQLFFPMITRQLSKKGNYNIKELSKQVGKWIFTLNLPIFLIIFLFPGAIINLLFGSAYLDATTSLRILSIGGFILSLSSLSTNLISTVGKSKLILFNIASTAALNIILSLILIPKYGINGAALATSISWILLSVLFFVEVKMLFGFVHIRRKMVRILLVSLIPAGLIWYLHRIVPKTTSILILSVILFFLFYILLVFLVKGLDKNDLSVLKKIKERFYKKR